MPMPRASLSRRLRFVAVLAVAAACTPSYTRWTNGASDPAAPAVVFLGDSLTAGQGVSSEEAYPALVAARMRAAGIQLDRKSTRLNSSHSHISYAVFCL